MPRNEDGELEVVVGNRQLLSVLFILLVLCGVVFTMGYFVGRNSAQAVAAAGPATPITVTETAERPRQPAASPAPLAAENVAPAVTPLPTPEPGESVVTNHPTVTPRAIATARPTPPPPEPAALDQPLAGMTYLQVAAVKQSMAEMLVDALKQKGFHAMTGDGPTPELFRVLVGPLKDMPTVVKTKADLEAAGFKSIVRKY